jgi:hypothetical protein
VVFTRGFAFGSLVVLLAMAGTRPSCSSLADEVKPKMAALGADVRIPTGEEAKAYGLGRLVDCANGQYVTRIHKGASAEKAGIRAGDVLLSLNANELYSGDDLQDFLRVMRPGTSVAARVKRDGTFKEEHVTLILGTGPEKSGQGIVWQYAGPGQLDSAIAAAKTNGMRLLVGLSGADTWWVSTRFESGSLSKILGDRAVVNAAEKSVRVIIRRPHAYQIRQKFRGKEIPIPGIIVLDTEGKLVGATPIESAKEVVEKLNHLAN